MNYNHDQPLIIQSDFTVLLEVNHPAFNEVRTELSSFADLVKSPEHIHTYRITPMSLWNAASAGIKSAAILNFLQQYSKFDTPLEIRDDIVRFIHRYGLIRMESHESLIHILSSDPKVIEEIQSYTCMQPYNLEAVDAYTLELNPKHRGSMKQELIRIGYPVEDLVGYHQGELIPIEMNSMTDRGDPISLRDYQVSALESFYKEGSVHGGSGVLVLPCGSGKTIIGIAAMAQLSCATLILTSSVTSVRQWKQELLQKTNVTEEMVGEYTGANKCVRPITIATYQILTHRKLKKDDFLHMKLFNERDWGLIIYDEVHLLPAPVFRVTADIQATRRLGLTATLVREDRREEDVFSLVGPKRYDAPWKDLEEKGWIAKVQCTEIRVPLTKQGKEQYMQTERKYKHRFAGENPMKLEVIQQLLQEHKNKPTLIIGQYLEQLKHIANSLHAPFVNGQMPHNERDKIYHQFNKGQLSLLVVSKVANFAVDLPDAAVAIQVSGSFGSRQEEAQRLGRILRPKASDQDAYFYTVVSGNTCEQEFAMKRQMFLVEQGYRYQIREAEKWLVQEERQCKVKT